MLNNKHIFLFNLIITYGLSYPEFNRRVLQFKVTHIDNTY